jgi:hypothetical protein
VQSVPSERALAKLAARQYGHVTYGQLVALGFTRSAIGTRIKQRRLIRVFARVYAVGHVRPEAVARAAAAVLAGGDGAVLSHFSAAALWGFRDDWPARPEITLAAKRRPTGIRVHVQPALHRSKDIRRHRSIRVTGPARTLLDIAPRLTEPTLARAVNEARLNSGLCRSHLAALLARQPRHPGIRLLERFVDAPSGPTRSEFEDRFLELARDHGLPTPLINVYVCGFQVDVYFPVQRVIVELDGWNFHQTRRAFERDRERDAVTLAAGIVTVRITWERLVQTPEREAARLRAILETRL